MFYRRYCWPKIKSGRRRGGREGGKSSSRARSSTIFSLSGSLPAPLFEASRVRPALLLVNRKKRREKGQRGMRRGLDPWLHPCALLLLERSGGASRV